MTTKANETTESDPEPSELEAVERGALSTEDRLELLELAIDRLRSEHREPGRWTRSVEAFEASATGYLSDADLPQLVALYSIAAELDGGTFQAALISQFTLTHRTLRAKDPELAAAARAGGPRPNEAQQVLDMFLESPVSPRATGGFGS